jgi:hypothetical protein
MSTHGSEFIEKARDNIETGLHRAWAARKDGSFYWHPPPAAAAPGKMTWANGTSTMAAKITLNEPHLTLLDRAPVLIRRLVAEDAALYPDFLSDVTAEDLRLRFFAPMREVSHELALGSTRTARTTLFCGMVVHVIGFPIH